MTKKTMKNTNIELDLSKKYQKIKIKKLLGEKIKTVVILLAPLVSIPPEVDKQELAALAIFLICFLAEARCSQEVEEPSHHADRRDRRPGQAQDQAHHRYKVPHGRRARPPGIAVV